MSENSSTGARRTSRRAVVGGVVGAGVGLPLLAACGSGGGAQGGNGAGGGSTASASGPVGKTTQVPVGSGKIFPAEKVVVTQPTQGDFKAFSAVCTHQGCLVAEVKGGDIDCNCHGSQFSITDGSVVTGPATKPLPQFQVKVDGDEISVS